MKTEKLLLALRISAIIAAVVDALFVILCAVMLWLLVSARLLIAPWVGYVCLAVIIINGAFLCVAAAYLIFRKR